MPTIDGIVSGLDTTALIDSILAVAAVPMIVMEDQLSEYEDRLEAVSGLKNRMDDLVATIEDMDEVDEFASYAAELSEEGYFTATVDSDVNPGTYDIEVLQLADSEVEVSQGFADRDSTGVIAEGTLSLTYGTDSYNITVDASNSSMELIAEQIDAIDGLTAYVMDTGAATDPYRLVIQGEDTGAANTITVDTSGLTGGGTVPVFTENSTAADAQVTVNGVTVNSESNTFTDLVPGLDVEASALTSGEVTVTVSTDTAVLEERVQTFIDAYNSVIEYYNTNTSYNPDEGIRGGLVGESSARSAVDGLGRLVSDNYSGIPGNFSSLSQVGIATESDGTLTLDTEAFQEALDSDYDSVEALFTTEDPDTMAYGPMAAIREGIKDIYVDEDTGTLTSRTDSLEETIEDYEDRISDFEAYLESYEERLRAQFTYMETVLAELYAAQDYLTALFASATGGATSNSSS